MGNPRKPTNILKLSGNPGGRPLPENEPDFTGGTTCPPYLSGVAKAEWRRLAPALEANKLLTVGDRATFAAYCQAWADAVAAWEHVRREGLVLESNTGGRYANPAAKIANDAANTMLRIGRQFGLTPSARATLGIQPQRPKNRLLQLIEEGKSRRKKLES